MSRDSWITVLSIFFQVSLTFHVTSSLVNLSQHDYLEKRFGSEAMGIKQGLFIYLWRKHSLYYCEDNC